MFNENVLTIQAPNDLKQRIELIAKEERVSINQLAIYIFAKEIGKLEARHQIAGYWKDYPKERIYSDFDSVMEKVDKRDVPNWDKIEV